MGFPGGQLNKLIVLPSMKMKSQSIGFFPKTHSIFIYTFLKGINSSNGCGGLESSTVGCGGLESSTAIWVCRSHFEFATVVLSLSQSFWVCRSHFEYGTANWQSIAIESKWKWNALQTFNIYLRTPEHLAFSVPILDTIWSVLEKSVAEPSLSGYSCQIQLLNISTL